VKDRRLQGIWDASQIFLTTVEMIDKGHQLDLPLLLEAYVDTRRRLTKQIAQIAAAQFPGAQAELSEVTRSVQGAIDRELHRSGWPGETLRIEHYGKTHALLLAYLRLRQSDFASTFELRLLVGDQVHTERRLRELRDLGFLIERTRSAGQDGYRLLGYSPDLELAVTRQLMLMSKRAPLGSPAKGHLESLIDSKEMP